MKEHPILFSRPMIHAILAGKKTQTRRTSSKWASVQAGDRLWVRETWRADDYDAQQTIYQADIAQHLLDETKGVIRWKPSIHMHQFRSRITLEILSIRQEPLQTIPEHDARAEGVEATYCKFVNDDWNQGVMLHRPAFVELWKSINGAASWDSNPLVWVVEFKPIKP